MVKWKQDFQDNSALESHISDASSGTGRKTFLAWSVLTVHDFFLDSGYVKRPHSPRIEMSLYLLVNFWKVQ